MSTVDFKNEKGKIINNWEMVERTTRIPGQ